MDLRAFLQSLASTGELNEISVEVSHDQQIAAICRREFATVGGKALLFRQVKDSSYPVVANLFGSESRASKLLYADSFAGFSERLHRYLDNRVGSASNRLNSTTTSSFTNSTQSFATTEIKLSSLPAIKSWPQEPHGYLNLALAISESPEDGTRNLGLYRGQIIDNQRIALNFSAGSGLATHLQQAKDRQQKLPVTLFLGADPALIWLACAPLPPKCDEFALYSGLFGKNLEIAAGITNSIQYPASAEFVIEGTITPGETTLEGPFGNHSGQYVTRSDCPVLQVKSVHARDSAIYSTTVVGTPPSENIYLGKANEILIKQMLQIDYPLVSDIYMPKETIFHGVAFLAIKPQSAVTIKKMIYTLWENSPLQKSKLLVLLDEDIDLSSASKCWWRTINQLKTNRIYQSDGRTAIDATGVNPAMILTEDMQITELLQYRLNEDEL